MISDMAINKFEFLHNDTIYGMSNSKAEFDTIVPECGSNTDSTAGTAGTRTASSTFTNSSTIKTTTSLTSKTKIKSPYLTADKVHTVSRRTEQSSMQRMAMNVISSSFPYAADIYKASSDQFRAQKNSKKRKTKKSVLTLPTHPAPMPQECTVSDMNESEYYMHDKQEKQKHKRITQMKKKNKLKKTQKIIDRDLKYCRQFNIDLYCSSTDSTTKAEYSEMKTKPPITKTRRQHDPQDVWSVLQSINKFQFKPTPDSSVGSKKKRAAKRRRKDHERAVNSVFASCCTTEEFAFLSTVDIEQDECKKSVSSGITVIDERDRLARLCKRTTQSVKEKLALKEKEFPVIQNDRATSSKHKKPGNSQVNARNARRKAMLKNALQNQKKDIVVEELDGKQIQLCKIISTKSSKESLEFKDNAPLGLCDNNRKTYNAFGKTLSKGDIFIDAVEKQKDSINEIIKVILHKGKGYNNVQRSPSPVKDRKPRLCTTITSAHYAPHLTKTEIRKQMYRLKYPIVVLGREELTSAYYVMNNELPPQFGGLDKMSWPFMKEWYDIKENIKLEINKDVDLKSDLKSKPKCTAKLKIDKVVNTEIESLYRPKREVSTYSRSQQSRKNICNLKDKVLEILSKKSSMIKSNIQSLANKVGSDNKKTTICENVRNAGPKFECAFEKGVQSFPTKLTICNIDTARGNRSPGSPVKVKGAWCKAPGSNDFINNVIQKVSAGVYYSQDKKKIQSFEYKEASIQTLSEDKKNTVPTKTDRKETTEQISELKYIYQRDPLNAIGFDEVLSGLKIESLDENQIAVKHCITNIVIHFDVTVLPVGSNVLMESQAISCKPLHGDTGHARAFKSDSIIINDKLPAEVCAVIPKMMRNILQRISGPPLALEPPLKLNTPDKRNIQTILPAISENVTEIHVTPVPHTRLSREVMEIIEGNFKAATRTSFKANTIDSNIFEVSRRSDLLTTPKTLWHLNAKVRAMPRIKEKLLLVSNKNIMTFKSISNATINKLRTVPHRSALQSYIGREPRLISYDEYTLSTMARNIINFFMGQTICNTSSYLYPLLNTILDRKLSMNIKMGGFPMLKFDEDGIFASITNNSKIENKPVIIVETDKSKLKIIETDEKSVESVKTVEIGDYEDPDVHTSGPHGPRNAEIKEIDKESKELTEKGESTEKRERDKYIKTKKKRFVKLYRKCKSATNISDKLNVRPLAKINSVEEFFQALGPDKSLASVLDGAPAQKTLDYIKEMKSWITEITPKQALLVLLLTNKKETPSLTRFRLLILQAIAVNRITRASELDMEIEVIERENFQINTDVGITSRMQASSQNDGLLEELCWIAKTTASDYQRPFDESSEALLKSLIDKRKQLNPSYLRVMARYVGLGLLKTPSKN